MTVDKLLNRDGEIVGMGLGGKQLDFMCDMDPPHPSLGTSNSCCFLASLVPSPASSLLAQAETDGTTSPPHTLAPESGPEPCCC
jgi:hypothetical protein